jgi:hypothetical protein
VLATPTDAVSPTSARTAALIAVAIAGGGPKSASDPATSRNASSIETCSTRGVYRPRISITARLAVRYFAPFTGRKTPSGHKAAAVRNGIAEWTPKRRAS